MTAIFVLKQSANLPEENMNQNQLVSCSSQIYSMDNCTIKYTITHTIITKLPILVQKQSNNKETVHNP